MNLQEIGKNFKQTKENLNNSVFEFVNEIQKRIKRGIANEHIWDPDVPRNLDGLYVENILEYPDYMEFRLYSHDPYDDMHESYIVKYLNIYTEMTLNEIADYIMEESVKLNKEHLIRDIELQEDYLRTLKERLNGLD